MAAGRNLKVDEQQGAIEQPRQRFFPEAFNASRCSLRTKMCFSEDPMHGEYKTPGGKLVAVDLEVEDGNLRNVTVSGDFFLYPEEALSTITGALEGLPVELSESEIAEQVRMAMPRDAELLGSSPEAIGAAVRRALAGDPEDRP